MIRTAQFLLLLPLLFLLLAGGSRTAFGQQPADSGEVTGRLIDLNSMALPGANVVLRDTSGSNMLTGTAADDSGEFSLEYEPGTYQLLITYVTYTDYKADITIVSGEVLDLGSITLVPDKNQLEEVLVERERSFMEMNFDSRSFNVGNDITSLGGSALDVLDNVPSITTDFEGNVSLRGNQGVQILINSRPSSLVRNGTDALSSIPASMIDRIEIITNPSSRYAAEGTAGIINIILVDNQQLGFHGSIQSNVGYPQDHGMGVNLNYNVNNINWFLNLDFEYEREPESGSTFQSFRADTSYTFSERSDVTETELEGDAYFGAEFFLPHNQVLTLSSRISIEDGEEDRDRLYTDYITPPGVFREVSDSWEILRQTTRRDIEQAREYDYSIRLQYENRFSGDDHRLTVDADYEFGSEDETARLFEVAGSGGNDPQIQRTFADEVFSELRVDADYRRPVGNSGRFEAGMRVNFEQEDNGYRAQEMRNGTWVDFEEAVGVTDNFSYMENVNALYTNYSGAFSGFTYQLGVRAENTRIESKLDQTGDSSEQNYLNLFPSLFLSYALNETNSFQVSYSRRVSRPRSGWLLPFIEINDVRTRSVGNPDLRPEFGNSYELGYLRMWESGSLLTSVYYRYRTDVIERVNSISPNGITTRRPINLATEESWGIEFSADQDLFSNLQLSASLNLFQSERDGFFEGLRYSSESESFTSRIRLRWKFLDGWNLQSYLYYRGSQQTTQGRDGGSAFLGAGISREVLGGRGLISLNGRDLFDSRQSDREIIDPDSYTNSRYSWSTRSFRLNFRYSF
jgi:outer membrane receptor protein involved in Fe transport